METCEFVIEYIDDGCQPTGSSVNQLSSTEKSSKNRGKYFKSYTEADLRTAIEEIQEGNSTICNASKKYQIPGSTLSDRLRGKYMSNQHGKTPVLSAQAESGLAEWILSYAKIGDPRTKEQLLQAASELAQGSDEENKRFKNELPTSSWLNGFIKRHPELSLLVGKTFSKKPKEQATTPEKTDNSFKITRVVSLKENNLEVDDSVDAPSTSKTAPDLSEPNIASQTLNINEQSSEISADFSAIEENLEKFASNYPEFASHIAIMQSVANLMKETISSAHENPSPTTQTTEVLLTPANHRKFCEASEADEAEQSKKHKKNKPICDVFVRKLKTEEKAKEEFVVKRKRRKPSKTKKNQPKIEK